MQVLMRAFSSLYSSFSSPWPDPNSPVLAKIDFGVPVSEVLLWLQARDTFLGENGKKQDIKLALNLAQHCKHPDAVWLTSICDGKDVSTKERAREVFLLKKYDADALCFAWYLTAHRTQDLSFLERAAGMGSAFACSTLSTFFLLIGNMEETFHLAQFAAATHERGGYYLIGACLCDGDGCEKNVSLGKENFLISAELGDAQAADAFGDFFAESDPVRWLWWSRAASRGYPDSFLDFFSDQVKMFFSGSGNATVVFLIGRALKGSIDLEKKEIFGFDRDFDSLIGPANQAVSFYDFQIKYARFAVETWTLVATRMYIIKDMRIFIGKMIWEARFEANYKI